MAAQLGAMLGAAIPSAVGGTIGLFASLAGARRAKRQYQAQLDEIDRLPLPDEEKMRLSEDVTRQFQQFAPEALGPSAEEQITEDPRLRAAQLAALEQMTKQSTAGMSDQARLQMAQAQMQAGQQARANREAAMAQAARRGVGGSGIALATQAMGDQDVYGQNYMAGMNAAAMDEDARYRALQGMADIGGQMRGQDFDINQARASAADRIKQFNAAARNNFQGDLMAARMRAQEHNAGVAQQGFQNRLSKQQLKSGARGQMADYYGRVATGGLNMGSAGMQGVGNAFATGAGGAK